MWLDNTEWSIAVHPGLSLLHVEHHAAGSKSRRVLIRRGETKNARGFQVEQVSPSEVHVTMNEHGATVLEKTGFTVIWSAGERVWLRFDDQHTPQRVIA